MGKPPCTFKKVIKMIVSWLKVSPERMTYEHASSAQCISMGCALGSVRADRGQRELFFTVLPPAQHLNETDRDSDKCTRRTGNLVSVTGLLVTWGGQKGKLL